jgi:segregation and condensation protein A
VAQGAAKELQFDDPDAIDRGDNEPALIVDVDGFAGPLDLLLELARRQKVDLAKISVLALAEQYLVFIEEARKFRLELAADYLVMAAWLAYLKSRLLLPQQVKDEEGPSAAELATALAFKLRRLEAMREASKKMHELHQLGRDVFARGAPEPMRIIDRPQWEATLYELLEAYSRQRQKSVLGRVTLKKRFFWSLVEAREALSRLVGKIPDWEPLDSFLFEYIVEPSMRRTVRASAFSATLEMVREGMLDVRQDRAFAPIYVKTHTSEAPAVQPSALAG